MDIKHNLNFTTSESHSKLLDGKTRYVGQLRHNNVRTPDSAREAFAEYSKLPPYLVTAAIDALRGFIVGEVSQGNRLDFGTFSIGLRLKGGFAAANAQFDESSNSISVELVPGKALREAVKALNPINVTDDGGLRLIGSHQISPFDADDAIATTGERIVTLSGHAFATETPPVGVWIEDDLGQKLITAEVLSASDRLCKVRFADPIAAGLYWLVLAKTYHAQLCTARRRLTARIFQ